MSEANNQRRIRALKAEIAALKGDRLLASQAEDLQWYRRQIREEVLVESYLAMSKQLYCQMAGRTRWVVEDYGRKYGIPLDGTKVDLYKVIKAFHDFIDANKEVLENSKDVGSVAAEKAKLEIAQVRRKAELIDLQVQEKKKALVDRKEVASKLVWVSEKLRSLGDRLGRIYGQEAQLAVNEYLEEMAQEVEGGKLRIGEEA